jgi:cell division septation protein DedD
VNRGLAPVALVVALLLAGCSRQEAAWRSADSAGTVAAYETYLESYPAGTHAATARVRAAALREAREWSHAERLGTPESYQRYLAAYPDGQHAATARDRLAVFMQPPVRQPAARLTAPTAATPQTAASTGSVAQPPPSGADAGAAPANQHWLQLGAFVGGRAAAEDAWQQLVGQHGDLLHGLEHRVILAPLDSGDLWRLSAGPLAADEGAARCAALQSRGSSCLLRAE